MQWTCQQAGGARQPLAEYKCRIIASLHLEQLLEVAQSHVVPSGDCCNAESTVAEMGHDIRLDGLQARYARSLACRHHPVSRYPNRKRREVVHLANDKALHIRRREDGFVHDAQVVL